MNVYVEILMFINGTVNKDFVDDPSFNSVEPLTEKIIYITK